jgi:multiple sugar transport system substrate-binding protein
MVHTQTNAMVSGGTSGLHSARRILARAAVSAALACVMATGVLVLPGCDKEGGGDGAKPAASDLKGQTVKMRVLGLEGWAPSRLGVDMAPLFAKFAKEKYGYDASFEFTAVPFGSLLDTASKSLAAKSQEYNLIVVDSQWLGVLAEKGGIVNIGELIKTHPELDIAWCDPVVRKSYMVYPDGSDQLWGLPQEGDVMALFVRKDLVTDAAERQAFKARFGKELPQTFEDFERLAMPEFEEVAAFFTRPDKNLYGTALQYQKTYDFMTMFLYPFIYSQGGNVWEPVERRVWGVLNSDINARAMEWNRKMLKYQPPDALEFGIGEESRAFTAGRLATAFQWAALGEDMIPTAMKEKVLVVPPPGFRQADGTLRRVYPIGGQPWVINAHNDAAHMRVAVDFLAWWYQPETQLEFARRGGNSCVKATLATPDFDHIKPWFRTYRYMLNEEHSRDFWHDPTYAELLRVQQDGWTAFAQGKASDAKAVLDWIAGRQQKILFDAGRSKVPPPAGLEGFQLK